LLPKSACRPNNSSKHWLPKVIDTASAWWLFHRTRNWTLRRLAAASDNRKIHLVPVKELQKLTGYIRGGVTALAAKKTYPVYVDETMELFGVISVSARIRGPQILLAPADYLRATKATVVRLAHGKP
jgi:Cys-tRNA(Pro) deacylase